jgi:hypothetical protein
MIRELYECQLCEEIYFSTYEALKEHLKCYHPKEFEMLGRMENMNDLQPAGIIVVEEDED